MQLCSAANTQLHTKSPHVLLRGGGGGGSEVDEASTQGQDNGRQVQEQHPRHSARLSVLQQGQGPPVQSTQNRPPHPTCNEECSQQVLKAMAAPLYCFA